MSEIKLTDKQEEKNKGGRPTLYKEEYAEIAYNYCLLGATDKDLAKFFDVQESTINNWKNDYPEFLESLKKGKEIADATIARRLFERAKGAVVNAQQAFKVKTVGYIEGNRVETENIEVIDLKQEQAPDTTAAIFWLKNRSPEKWRDKQEMKSEVETKATVTIVPMDGAKQTFASSESDVDA